MQNVLEQWEKQDDYRKPEEAPWRATVGRVSEVKDIKILRRNKPQYEKNTMKHFGTADNKEGQNTTWDVGLAA